MADPVRIKVDLASGIVEVEASADAFADIFDRLQDFLPRLTEVYGGKRMARHEAGTAQEIAEEPARRKSKRTSPTRKEVYKHVDLGLSPEQRDKLRSFYQEKSPKNQNEQTAVLMSWLKREHNISSVDRDHIYTAFRTVNAKVPGKIGSVLGNMVGQGWVVGKGDGKYELTHVGEDHVKFELPRKKNKKGERRDKT